MIRRVFVISAALLLSACATAPKPDPQDAFFAGLKGLCGMSFAGAVVSTDPADADFAGKPLVMTVAECDDRQVRIPFRVGEDRSRTWVINRTDRGLRLKHDHRHGAVEDDLSQYGGDTVEPGAAARQEFPADAFSRTLFQGKGNPASVDNVWAVEVRPGRTFAYELRRPKRFFRVEFDLSKPL